MTALEFATAMVAGLAIFASIFLTAEEIGHWAWRYALVGVAVVLAIGEAMGWYA